VPWSRWVFRPCPPRSGRFILKVQERLWASAREVSWMRKITLEDYKRADRQLEREQARPGFTIHAILYVLVMTGLIILNLTVATEFPWAVSR
jgi:hypothetical protein